ncbi:DUF2867 domain-containing protein [Mesorhizobium sp. M0276]|uniref:DUF2867 domain-containing protein n=1 Tax=Mesorhizobium sp. M0276 TaxID=2956928 RepID=UPI00333A7376
MKNINQHQLTRNHLTGFTLGLENAKNKGNPASLEAKWRRFATQCATFAPAMVVSEDLPCQEVAATTIVKTHNWLGRAYLAIVMPFHRIIVPAMLAQVLTK